ncbi:MAG: bifunctional 3-phenylpropionate/cinnamic acid dioxygenase ferredoxin subunit [Nocardioidaceae bacterium]
MSDGIRVASVDDIPEGEAVSIPPEVTGLMDPVGIFHDDGEFFALDDICTHEEAYLSEGWIEDGEVECPLHASRFCLRTGEVRGLPATVDAKTFRVEVRDGAIWMYPDEPARSKD